MKSLLFSMLVGIAHAQSYAAEVAGPILKPIEDKYNASIESILKESPITSQTLNDFIDTIEVLIVRNSHVYRDGTQLKLNGIPWTASGANVYWLGLDENVIPPAEQPFYAQFNASYPTKGRITEVMNTLSTMGARTIRSQTIGVSVGNPLSVMPSLGVYNEQAFDTIDWAVYQAREHGLRVFAPLIDNYDYYHGGKYDFLRFRGIYISTVDGYSKMPPEVLQFYTNATIIQDFKNYIYHLLIHLNPYTGLTYAEDPTIFAYETGNELGGPIFGDAYVPNSWTAEITSFIKSLAPKKLVIDGTYGINATHFEIESVDIFSDHFYPLNLTKLTNDIDLVRSANRVYIAGEYDWTGNTPSPSLSSFYSVIEAQQSKPEPVVAGDLFWSLFVHDVPNCNRYVNHSDGFSLQYGNPLNSVQNDTQIATIREHLFKMRNETANEFAVEGAYLPCVACPGPVVDYTYV